VCRAWCWREMHTRVCLTHEHLRQSVPRQYTGAPALAAGALSSGAAVTGARGVSTKAAGVTARVCAVLGAQWGDEGKGKLADVLAKQ
jgi:hypothetical protein